MAVDYDTFLAWAQDRFGAENIKIKHTSHGEEILTHSFYAHRKGIDDYTHNLWMSPSGGKAKHNPEKGSFRCWKTDTMGTLVKLVADYDSIDYEEAENLICGSSSLRALEIKVHEFFGSKPDIPVELPEGEEPIKGLCLPENTYLIDKMEEWDAMANIARNYLVGRKISTKGLYFCTEGEYSGRIIIPYFDRDGNLIWYNARTPFDKKSVIKYLKCKSDGLNITQEDVLYVPAWPAPGQKLYIMEGEIDAISMRIAGLYSCAIGGKFMSDTQIEMIRQYIPVLAFDADEGSKRDSGLQALVNVGKQLMEKGFPKIGYVRPPKAFKDWNKLLVERNAETIKAYAEKFEKVFTASTPDLLLAQRL